MADQSGKYIKIGLIVVIAGILIFAVVTGTIPAKEAAEFLSSFIQ